MCNVNRCCKLADFSSSFPSDAFDFEHPGGTLLKISWNKWNCSPVVSWHDSEDSAVILSFVLDHLCKFCTEDGEFMPSLMLDYLRSSAGDGEASFPSSPSISCQTYIVNASNSVFYLGGGDVAK